LPFLAVLPQHRDATDDESKLGSSRSKGMYSWKSSPNWPRGFSIKLLMLSSVLTTRIRWNRASTALFGYSTDEALGQSLNLIIPEHLRSAHWRGFETAMTKGVMKLHGRPTLTRASHKSGRKLYIEMTFAIVKDGTAGEVLGSVAVARDVTERVERRVPRPAPLETLRGSCSGRPCRTVDPSLMAKILRISHDGARWCERALRLKA
jgi:PAS domain S-box-containing protein